MANTIITSKKKSRSSNLDFYAYVLLMLIFSIYFWGGILGIYFFFIPAFIVFTLVVLVFIDMGN
jgi:uncharacterized membrane protein